MNWSEADRQTRLGKMWGFVDLSQNFTNDTIEKLFKNNTLIF